MRLSSTLTWLVDAASASPGAERFLAELGTRLIADDIPLAGGALTLAVPPPIIARRTWLWRGGDAEGVGEGGDVPGGGLGAGGTPAGVGRGGGGRGFQGGGEWDTTPG